MKNTALLLLLLPALLFTACKDDDDKYTRPKCESVVHAPAEFLDYWFFPKGSWWVYKLKGSEPAVYDTVRNTGRVMAFYAEPDEDPGMARNCEMFYIHDLVHSNRQYFSNAEPNRPGAEGLRGFKFGDKWVIEQTWDSWGHAAEGFVFFYPFVIGEELNSNHNWVADTNAVVTPYGSFDGSVGMFLGYGFNPDTSSYPQRRIHFSRGVGVTKRRYFNNQEWELVNYHINR